jgi:hypothetical protein
MDFLRNHQPSANKLGGDLIPELITICDKFLISSPVKEIMKGAKNAKQK